MSPPVCPDQRIRRYWFGDLASDGWIPASDDPASILQQLYSTPRSGWSMPTWENAVLSGFCTTKEEYYSRLRDLCIYWTDQEMKRFNSSGEARLIHLVLLLRETDLLMGRVREQIEIWNRMTEDDCDQSVSKQDEEFPDSKSGIITDTGPSLLIQDLTRMKISRSQISQDIIRRSEMILPNCSSLVGPLVAARLLAGAGSLKNLSRMPGSGIQVLGAKNAFFSHKKTGCPPPKHGLLFEHKRVHASPRKVRGKVARTLASALAIASRIDYYRGVPDPLFLERANRRIDQAGRRS